MNIIYWRTIIWQQFGAAIDMLDNTLRACPDQLWRDSLWNDPTDAPEGFVPPAPFIRGTLPEKPYTKDELQTYLNHCRQKCQATFETLTDEKAYQTGKFPWGEDVSLAELQLYSMRHVQEHAAQLSLLLGHKVGSAPDWVARAEHKTV
jgi:hypothetical protein